MPSKAEVMVNVLNQVLDSMAEYVAEHGDLKDIELTVSNIDEAGECEVTIDRPVEVS